MRDDDESLRATVEIERARDPETASREFDCESTSAGAGVFFDPVALDRCVMHPLPEAVGHTAAAADFGFVSDASALVCSRSSGDRIVVVHVEEQRPTRGRPLVPSAVAATFAASARFHGAHAIMSDSHYALSIAEHLSQAGVDFLRAPANADGKLKTHLRVREIVNAGRLVLPQHARLLHQLKSLVSRPQAAGGMSITHPRRSGQGHGDIASACVLSVYAATLGATSLGKPIIVPHHGGGIGGGFVGGSIGDGFAGIGGRW